MKHTIVWVFIVAIAAAGHAATEYSRQLDFSAGTARAGERYTHGSLLKPAAVRWSYHLVTAKQREKTEDAARLLADPLSLTPLAGFASRTNNGVFQRHAYVVTADALSLTWNYNPDNPATEWSGADLAVFFHAPEEGTYSIAGDLFWRSTLPTDMSRRAGLLIGVLRGGKPVFKPLFETAFIAPERFAEPRPVVGFAGNRSLQNLTLEAGDRIVFLWRSDLNYRGLEGIDKGLRIIHAEGASLPADPVEINTIKSYQQLFSLMNLARPDLAEVRTQFEAGDYRAAMRAYRQVLVQRMAALPRQETFSYWLYGVADADQLVDGKLTTVKYGDNNTRYTFEIGKPGHINFFKAASADYDTTIRDISSMHWPTKYAEAYLKTRDIKYLKAWVATWDDFAVNWESQYDAVKKDPSLWGLRPDGKRNLVGIDWLNAQLYLAWRLESLHAGLVAVLQTAGDAGQIDQIDPAALARILIRAATVETSLSMGWLNRAEKLVPNQIRHLAGEMFKWGTHFSEFQDAARWREQSVPVLTMTHNPDGTDRENSLNYFSNNLKDIIEIMQQLPEGDRDSTFLAGLEKRSICRDRFIPAIVRPDGFSPTVGKNIVWRNFGQTQDVKPFSTAFTSVLFPYGGFAVQRDGWSPDSLYLFMKINRPSIGHWRAQDGGLQLSAFGRNLLVSAVGEVYASRDGEMGWGGYWYSAAGQNTILVDGMSSQRRTGGFDQLDPMLWNTSANFDLMETGITGPYEGWNFRTDGSNYGAKYTSGKVEHGNSVADVTHRRQAHFLRGTGCWIITDRVASETAHDFTQTWCFGPEFSADEVVTDLAQKRIFTRQPDAPNLSLYQFGTPALDYKKYFGVYSTNQILGWVGILQDREKWIYTPSPNIHANWNGQGGQLLVTLAVPHRGVNSPVTRIVEISKDAIKGFDAELADGTCIFYRAAVDKSFLEADGLRAEAASLLVQRDRTGARSGIVLGARMFEGTPSGSGDFEFSVERNGVVMAKNILAPRGFEWIGNSGAMIPDYGNGTNGWYNKKD